MSKRGVDSLGQASACEPAHKRTKLASNDIDTNNLCQRLSTIERLPTELLEKILFTTKSSELVRASPYIATRLSQNTSLYSAFFIQAFYGRHLPQLREHFRFEHFLPSDQAEYTSWDERHVIRSCLQAPWCTIQFAMGFSQGLLRMALDHINNNIHMKLHNQISLEINRLLSLTPEQMWNDIDGAALIFQLEIDGEPALLELHLLSVSITDNDARCCFNHVGRPPYFFVAPDILDNQMISLTAKRPSGESYNMNPTEPLWRCLIPSEDPGCSLSHSNSTTLDDRLVAYHLKLDECIRLRIHHGREFEEEHDWSNRSLQQMLRQQYLWQQDETIPYKIQPDYYEIALPQSRYDPETGFDLLTLYEIDPTDYLNGRDNTSATIAKLLLQARDRFRKDHPDKISAKVSIPHPNYVSDPNPSPNHRRQSRLTIQSLESSAASARVSADILMRMKRFIEDVLSQSQSQSQSEEEGILAAETTHAGVMSPDFRVGSEYHNPDFIKKVTDEELRRWIGEEEAEEDEEVEEAAEEDDDGRDSLFGDEDDDDDDDDDEEEEEEN